MARTRGRIPEKMNAIVKRFPGPGAHWSQVPVPLPGPGEVLVRVLAAAICGTDVHIYEWNQWAAQAVKRLPQVMGHEFSGEVVAVGEGVRLVQEGDLVAGETHEPCGQCYQCLNGQQHICANMRLFGVDCDGCFASYAVLPEICARPIPPEISPEFGAIMEPLGTSVRAAMEAGSTGAKVLVAGAGPIGLGCVSALRAFGAAEVMVTDISRYRLAIASKLAADFCLNPAVDDVEAEVLKLTKGVGVDAFIDASGNVDAISMGLRLLRKGGNAVLVGLPSGSLSLEAGRDIIFKEAKIQGIHGREMFKTWTVMENLMKKRLLELQPIVTHRLPMSSFKEGFTLLKEGKASKIILLPDVEVQ